MLCTALTKESITSLTPFAIESFIIIYVQTLVDPSPATVLRKRWAQFLSEEFSNANFRLLRNL